MSNELIVADASPLIVLFQTGFAELLGQLWPEVVVPDAVWQEIQAHPGDPAATGLQNASWVRRVDVAETDVRLEPWNLGSGEAASLTFALQNADCLVLIDDALGRRCAKSLSIATLGTGGLLVLAKRHRLIASVTDALKQVRASGFWLSDEVVETLQRLAGERT